MGNDTQADQIKKLVVRVLELAHNEDLKMANGAVYREREWLQELGLEIPAPWSWMEKERELRENRPLRRITLYDPSGNALAHLTKKT